MTREPLRAVPSVDATEVICQSAREIANLLGLRNHTVEVSEEPPHDVLALAECELPSGRAHIRLRFSEEFFGLHEPEQRHALVHELLHAHFQRMTERTREVAAEHIGGVAFRVFWLGFRGDVEELVDRFASLLAPGMPPIEWPK